MTTESESAYNVSKPFMLIITAMVTGAISFVLFIVGLSFAKPVILWGHDITVAIAAGISFVITMIELSFNDAILDDEKDWIILLIGGAAYLLGISVGYVALMNLLDLGIPLMEKIASITLSVIFEVAPERLLIMGLRRLDIRWSDIPRRISASFSRARNKSSNNRSSQNQNRRSQNNNNQSTRPVVTQSPAYREAITTTQSQRTPKVQRPGVSNRAVYDPATYHTLGQQNPMEDIAAGFEETE
jgi:hypothetical protein